MTDQKKLSRLKLMIGHIDRLLVSAEPDLPILAALLGDALSLAIELNDPPDPYASKALRPGLTQEASDV